MTCTTTHGDDPCATCDVVGIRCERCTHDLACHRVTDRTTCCWAPTVEAYAELQNRHALDVEELVVLETRLSTAMLDSETARKVIVHAREILRAPRGEGLIPACERLVARLGALQTTIARLERQVREEA